MIRKLAELVKQLFRTRISTWQGVAVRDTPWWHPIDERPMHKTELWDATRSVVHTGDAVTFVGGGKGIVPVKAAEYGCDVTVIEAAAEMVESLRETATLNRVPMRIVHGCVEAGHDVYGDMSDARLMTSNDLSGDVLVLDCEGAERDILPCPQFDAVVVETHPQHGADTEAIREVLEQHGKVKHTATARHPGDFLLRT